MRHARVLRVVLLVLVAVLGARLPVLADMDDMPGSPAKSSGPQGLMPLSEALPRATPAPGESRLLLRPDGAYEAIPEVVGRTKTYHLVERQAPWTLRPDLTVMASTYNGVVPGPVLHVRQGERVVIDYENLLAMPDTIHLHGIHGAPVTMDGVPGISQAMVPQGGRYRYAFTADQPGTFIYHTHGREAMLDAGLYGAIIVDPTHLRPEERNIAHDDLELLSSWQIQSGAENVFTINGKAYPATQPIEVKSGDRVRIRWINISGEEFHTMHTHGHDQLVIARDAQPVTTKDVEDTVLVGPGQRADVIVRANAKPGTWMVHCHVADHTENAQGLPDGLITTIHYAGTPSIAAKMYTAMASAMAPMAPSTPGATSAPKPLSFRLTALLGAVAGFTIFLGLPIARAQRLKPSTIGALNALAIGILVYLVIEIATGALRPVTQGFVSWHAGAGAFPLLLVALLVGGLMVGLVGLGSMATQLAKRSCTQVADHPMLLAMMIALGIGAHNFAEGLAIGASAASGATAVAAGLIVGFALHNATEGFGIAAPLAGRMRPSWTQIGVAGLIAGGPTFLGTVFGYPCRSPTLSVFFLAIAVGALVLVFGELWNILRRTGLTAIATSLVTVGFALAFGTELFVDLNGG